MGMKADLIAIGVYRDDLVEYLDYGPWDYKDVKPNQLVITTLITCRTADASRELAAALGVGAMELGRHVFKRGLTPEQRRGVIRFLMKGAGSTAADGSVEAVDALSRNKWTFIYRPNA